MKPTKSKKVITASVKTQAETTKEIEIPELNPFDKTIFYNISFRELLVDALIVVFSFFISDEFFSARGIFETAKPWQILAMYCGVVLTLPYYFGYLYVHNSAYYSKPVMKFFLWLFIIMTVMALVNMMRLMYSIGDVQDLKNDESGFFAVFATFLLVIGPMMCIGGSATAYAEFSKQKEEDIKFNMEKNPTTVALGILVLAIAFMIYFIGLFPQKYSGLAAVLGMFAGPLAAVIVLVIMVGIFNLLSKIGIYRYLVIFAKNSFPLFIVAVLVFWSGVSIHFMKTDFEGTSGHLSWSAILFSVVISGLLPFRIISMLNPPWRISNIIIGTLTLTWFLYSLSKLTH
jgi:hypothetical protein